jgi:hypothetical protein
VSPGVCLLHICGRSLCSHFWHYEGCVQQHADGLTQGCARDALQSCIGSVFCISTANQWTLGAALLAQQQLSATVAATGSMYNRFYHVPQGQWDSLIWIAIRCSSPTGVVACGVTSTSPRNDGRHQQLCWNHGDHRLPQVGALWRIGWGFRALCHDRGMGLPFIVGPTLTPTPMPCAHKLVPHEALLA